MKELALHWDRVNYFNVRGKRNIGADVGVHFKKNSDIMVGSPGT